MKKIFVFFIIIGHLLGSEVITLRNGVKVVYRKVDNIEVFAAGVLIKGGVKKYEKGKDGIEYFSLKALLEGTKKYPFPELSRFFVKKGIYPSVNSEYDFTTLILKAPAKNYKDVLTVLYELFTEPELNEDRINVVKTQIISMIKRRKESPDEKLFDYLNDVFYIDHPYSIDPVGEVETVKKFGKNDVVEFLNKNFHSDGIVIGIVGPVEKEKLIPILEKFFGNLKKGKFVEKELPDFKVKDTVIVIKDKGLKTSYIACKFVAPALGEKHFSSLLLLMKILDDRFYEKVRTKAGLSYAVFAGISLREKNYGYFYVSSSYPDSAWSIMMKEVEELKTKKLDKNEILKAANMWKTYKYYRELSTDRTLYNLFLSYYFTSDPDYFEKIVYNLDHTSPDELIYIAQKYLKDFVILKLLY